MNPIIRLNKNYQSKFIDKLRNSFTDSQQQLFVASFFCYLNYNQKNDFVINLDDIWKWLGFERKSFCKRVLEKHFIIDIDYKIESYSPSIAGEKGFATTGEKAASPTGEPAFLSLSVAGEIKKLGGAGLNKEKIMMTIHTFKKLCLKSNTKKAEEIHEYYIKLEELTQEITNEESIELRKQLQIKEQELIEQIEINETEKQDLLEKTILDQFPENTQCIYYGEIDDVDSKGYKLAKYGNSNNLLKRIEQHKKTYTNFRLKAAFKVKNKIEIENAIKKHNILKNRLRSIMINDICYRELIALDDEVFKIKNIEEYFKEIIKENEYNIENYNLLLKKNDELQNEIYKLKDELNEKDNIIKNNSNKINKLEHDITDEIKLKICSNYAICKYGYFLYAYQYEDMKFICSISRQKDYETINNTLNDLYKNVEIKYFVKSLYPLTEKIMMFILKQNCVSFGQNKFESSLDNIKKILDISIKLEELLINQSKDLDTLSEIFSNNKNIIIKEEIDHEVPIVRKAKRSIDQINKDTGEVIKTFESIEAAGRANGLTTGTAIGVALREKRLCKGFIWRYSGISKEEQFNEQPVIKICCNNGEKSFFKTIADAAKDCNVSAPALRQRIITQVHTNNHHWIFNKTANHYN